MPPDPTKENPFASPRAGSDQPVEHASEVSLPLIMAGLSVIALSVGAAAVLNLAMPPVARAVVIGVCAGVVLLAAAVIARSFVQKE